MSANANLSGVDHGHNFAQSLGPGKEYMIILGGNE